LLLFFLWFCSFVSAADQRNLVLITIDTLRADYVSCNGSTKVQTPNIDRLANGGVNFQRVRTAVPLTLPAHTSILTALYPPAHGVRDNGTYVLAQDRLTLAEVLKQHGYTTAAFVGSFILDHRFGLAQGFDVYDDRITQDPSQLENLDAERNATAVDAAFAKWLDTYEQKAPVFLWIHLYDPHAPYVPPEPYRTRYQQNLYAGEIAYADEIVGKIVQQLQTRKLIDNSIIALVGDHGEALGEHEETTHSVLIYNSTLDVPMLIYAPGVVKPGIKIGSLSRTIDLAPTLLETLNISDKLGEGISWSSVIEQKGNLPPVFAYSESLYAKFNLGWSELRGIETEKYHYILSPKPELYDTQKDPAELNNLAKSLPAVARDLRQKLESLPHPAETRSQPLDEETREKLSSLGYISGSAPSAKSSSVNPRDKMAVSHKIQIGIADFTKGNFVPAAQTFQSILTNEPDIPLLYQYLGICYMRLERLPEARKVYEAAITRGIDSSGFRMNLGIIHTKAREFSRAQAELEKAIEMDPLNVSAYFYLADLLRIKGEPDQAIERYKKALEINPAYVYAVNGLGMSYAALKNDEKAVQYFKEAIKLEPQNPPGYFNLAVELDRIGRSKEALEAYKTFLTLSAGKEFVELRKKAAEAVNRLEQH
jgi:arylsulfatase A-like enzyme/cytochrome c-type biogenesis protein CcmH/NrfG